MASKPRLRRHRQTKIVATLGPASSSDEMIARLFHTGADVFRLNFSHGSHADHAARVASVRALEEATGRPIGLLADVQGPKLRIGRFGGGRVHLQTGQQFRLDTDPSPGGSRRVQLPHPEIMAAASSGTTLLLDDGKLRLRVDHNRGGHLDCEVMVGGALSDRKGVNVPDMMLQIPALTEKDKQDLVFALDQGVDFIGLSFVQRPEDVAEARDIADGRAWIVSKIEKPQALEQLDAIVELSDAVMVARGDLGVELPPEEVPLAQKRIIRTARAYGKPVIVATQMLEHDPGPGPDARGSERRRRRRLRRHGRGDAVGRDRGGPVSRRIRRYDGQDRHTRGAGRGLARIDGRKPPEDGKLELRGDSRRRRRRGPEYRRRRHRRLHRLWCHGIAYCTRTAEAADPGRGHGSAGCEKARALLGRSCRTGARHAYPGRRRDAGRTYCQGGRFRQTRRHYRGCGRHPVWSRWQYEFASGYDRQIERPSFLKKEAKNF